MGKRNKHKPSSKPRPPRPLRYRLEMSWLYYSAGGEVYRIAHLQQIVSVDHLRKARFAARRAGQHIYHEEAVEWAAK